MQTCHRIVALKQQSQQMSGIRAAGYSILFKGHWKLGDLKKLELALEHARQNQNMQHPDVVFMNSLMDASINCNALQRAKEAFGTNEKWQ
jgi:hypothetical protein